MTTWGHAHVRHDLWLRLKDLAEELQYIADQWLLYDLELRDIADINAARPEQHEAPIEPPPSTPHGKPSTD